MNRTEGLIGVALLCAWFGFCGISMGMEDAGRVPQPENFSGPEWSSLNRGGVWEIAATNEVRQTDLDEPWKNNGFNRAIEQSGVMEYEFRLRILSGGQCGAGIYVMANETNGVDRGTSYLLWLSQPAEGEPVFSMAKFLADKRQKWAPRVKLPAKKGDAVALRVRIDSLSGEIVVFCNGAEVVRFEDESPIRSGNHVSLHTCKTGVAYSDLRIRRIEQ